MQYPVLVTRRLRTAGALVGAVAFAGALALAPAANAAKKKVKTHKLTGSVRGIRTRS